MILFKGDEKFSKDHPLKINDLYIFLHGTSSNKFLQIKDSGFLLRKPPVRNYSLSQGGVYFEKYCRNYANSDVTRLTIKGCCQAACRNDNSSEGVILQIKGKQLNNLGCPIYADWNKHVPRIFDSRGIPVDVDSSAPVLSIIIDRDIPLNFLKVVKRLPFKDE